MRLKVSFKFLAWQTKYFSEFLTILKSIQLVPNQAKYSGSYFKNMGLVTLIKTFKGLDKCFFFFFLFCVVVQVVIIYTYIKPNLAISKM
jgi:hypothetical protein